MPTLSFEKKMPYGKKDLFDTVMDIEKYPEIFPFVHAIRSRKIDTRTTEALVTVNAPIMNFSYTCVIQTDEDKGTINIRATKGPFKTMNALWAFQEADDGQTSVKYVMDFDMGGLGLQNAIAKKFAQSQVEQTYVSLKAYLADKLGGQQASAPPPHKPPQP